MPVAQLAKYLHSSVMDSVKCCRIPSLGSVPSTAETQCGITHLATQAFKGGGRRIRSLRQSLATMRLSKQPGKHEILS